MPRGQSTRTRQLSLDLGRPTIDWDRVTRSNRLRHERLAAEQVRRCDRILAAQAQRETPPMRRCEICWGVELVATPHAHVAA